MMFSLNFIDVIFEGLSQFFVIMFVAANSFFFAGKDFICENKNVIYLYFYYIKFIVNVKDVKQAKIINKCFYEKIFRIMIIINIKSMNIYFEHFIQRFYDF